jgi:glutamyl-tRNA(Gln) amidotransferase subunit E
MLGATPVDEVQVMRKVVIDGSTPFGFQRTAVVALNGEITVDGKRIPIQTVCVEEDACRKIEEQDKISNYRLDRLGIPLVEVVTGPVIKSPKEAEEVAFALGRLLRASNKIKRGIGSIRQDLNVSINDGAIIEIKGVQELELISQVVHYEVQRQLSLLKIRNELKKRKITCDDFDDDMYDVTAIFKTTECQMLRKAVKSGLKIMAIILPNFSGVLGVTLLPGMRFGTELSDYAKFWGAVGGIFHSDELPGFGITTEEFAQLKSFLKVEEKDAIVFVCGEQRNVRDALTAVITRVKAAIGGITPETRSADLDGTTHYSRPRPGAARMYPETDVPPVPVTSTQLSTINNNLPEHPEVQLNRLMKNYNLNRKLALQLQNSEFVRIFEVIAGRTTIAASFIAATLTETLKSMKREGVNVNLISHKLIVKVFELVDKKVVAQEAIPDLLVWMVNHTDAILTEAVQALGLHVVSEEMLIDLIEKVVQENEAIIKKRGQAAFSPLMGDLMAGQRGKIDARKASQLLKKKINQIYEEH